MWDMRLSTSSSTQRMLRGRLMQERYGRGTGCTTRGVKDLAAVAPVPAGRWHPFRAADTLTRMTQVMVSANLLAVRFGAPGDVEECTLSHHLCLQEIQPDAVYVALCRVLA